ncbi:MAG: 2-hydroxyacid dehydrogenase [Verrucomicrobiae bacterium]|nr:2-hydroxyacid dehydrogenase [Verrucomicrobiae bacterium]
MSGSSKVGIFYNSQIPERLAILLRDMLPDGFELITLETDDDSERREKIQDARIVVVAAKPLREEILEAGSNVKLVHHQGVSFQDTLPLAAMKARGIRLAITPGGTTESVAEHTIMLMLAALRHLPYADSQLRQDQWLINELRLDSRELRFCRVGIVGMGRIGQAVARLLNAFGTTGSYYDPQVALPKEEERRLGFEKQDLETVLRSSQILTLHVPCNEHTRHIIDEKAMSLLPDKAVIINAARGGLIDEIALLAALSTGKLGAVALDCFEQEPPDPKSGLIQHPNVVLTPHIAAGTRDAITEKWRFMYRNMVSFTQSGHLENEIAL